MKCPFCDNLETQVKDSRQAEDGSNIRRRRFCPECGARFTTFERVQLREIDVIKSDGSIVSFDRNKLKRSLVLSTKKREISDERIEKIVSSIQRKLETSGDSEIQSAYIGQLVMEILANIDIVSYIRFASVYRDFKTKNDYNNFIDEISHKIDDKNSGKKSSDWLF